jgi:hypothetical protein
MPLTATTVECPECVTAFLAPYHGPDNPVQCPHCAGQYLRRQCREVEAGEFAQRNITNIRTEEQEAASIVETTRSQQHKMLVIVGSVVVLVGLGAYGAFALTTTKGAAEEARQAREAQVAANDRAVFDAAFSVAKEALGKPDWQEMFAYVRDAERVRPLAQWLYERDPYESYLVTGYKFPQVMKVGEDTFIRLLLYAKDVDRGFWVRLTKDQNGMKLDWEALGRYTSAHWDYFMTEQPTSPETFRVRIQRSSLPDRLYFERGFEGDGDAIGVRIWSLDAGKDVHAVIPYRSPQGKALANSVRWEIDKGFIVRLRWPDDSNKEKKEGGYQFVDLVEVVQPGWHYASNE